MKEVEMNSNTFVVGVSVTGYGADSLARTTITAHLSDGSYFNGLTGQMFVIEDGKEIEFKKEGSLK